jgi:hypothetical protein
MTIFLRIALAAALLPVTAMPSAPAFAQAPKQDVAAPAVKKEFEAFIGKFRAALKTNDSAAVAAMTKLPFMADKSIGDAAQFRAKAYRQNFTAKVRSCIQRAKPVYDRHENNDYYSIFCGEEIFLFARTPAGFQFTEIGVND